MTPDLKYKQYVLDKLVSDLEGFLVYYNPQFKSWWWINPDTKEWRFEFKDSGTLYWFYGWGDNFMFKYSLEESEFVEVISRYVEHTIQNGVVNTSEGNWITGIKVEHTLQKGVINTHPEINGLTGVVEHILQNGVVNSSPSGRFRKGVEETIENGIVNTQRNFLYKTEDVEHTLENGVINTRPNTMDPGFQIDHTLQNGITKIIPTYGGIDDEVIINQTINQ